MHMSLPSLCLQPEGQGRGVCMGTHSWAEQYEQEVDGPELLPRECALIIMWTLLKGKGIIIS